MAHGAANDLAQDVAAPFIRGHDAIADQERCSAAVVSENTQRRVGFRRSAVMLARKRAGEVHQRPKQIRFEVADLALQHRGEAFESRARVDRRLRQRRDVARGVAIELHKDKIPDLDVAPAVAAELAIGVTRSGGRRTHVVVNFAARAARAGVTHGPEVLFEPRNGNHARLGRAHVDPVRGGFVVRRQFFLRNDFSAAENREIKFVQRYAESARKRRSH